MKALQTLLLLILGTSLSAQISILDHDGGEFQHHQGECLTPEQRSKMESQIQENVTRLRSAGVLPATERNSLVDFYWPLEVDASLDWNNYYGISNYVDQDPSSGTLDHNCGGITYNGHAGTDYFTWPFPHYLKQNNLVSVIAAAPGTIVQKLDGNADEQCDLNSSLTWNAVYVMHSDGSIAWYGHLKEGSLTSKTIGESVTAGEYLGVVASSGFSSGPHLHFEIHDTNNNIIDPYSGTCNSLNAESWWATQPIYQEMQLNLHATHDQAPVQGCPSSNEEMHLTDHFDYQDVVYLGAYYKDQFANVPITYSVRDPLGTIQTSWVHQSTVNYTASWWWWTIQMPNFGSAGEWTFEVEFNGQFHSHSFFLDDLASGLEEHGDLEWSLTPNPVVDELNIKSNEKIERVMIHDVSGRLCLDEQGSRKTMVNVTNLEDGLYVCTVFTERGASTLRFVKD